MKFESDFKIKSQAVPIGLTSYLITAKPFDLMLKQAKLIHITTVLMLLLSKPSSFLPPCFMHLLELYLPPC